MAHPERFTVKQIVWKIGQRNLTRLLGVGADAQRKWYDRGIPGRHWRTLVNKYEWLSYEILDDATTIALKRFKRAA